MKRLISLALVLCLALGSVSFAFADEEQKAEPKKETVYRHLDMGVYCTIYKKNKDGNYEWQGGKAYGSVQPVDFTIKSKYLSNVNIKNVWAYDGSDVRKDDFQFNKAAGDSWNIPVNSFKEFNPYRSYENETEHSYYDACASRENITNLSATAQKDGIQLKYNVKLETPKSLDIAEISRKYIDAKTVSKEVQKVISTTVKKNKYTETEKAEFAKLSAAHKKNYSDWMKTASSLKGKAKREALNKANTELALAKKYDALSKNNSKETKPVNKVITETQEEVTLANSDLERYENEIYAYWGGKAGLEAQAKNDAGSKAILDALDKAFNDSYNNSEMKLMLVFVPVVVEFTKNTVICSRCGQCEVDPAIGYCTAESCSHFGTDECGCYEPPEIKVISYDKCSNCITWSERKYCHKVYCGGENCKGHKCYHTAVFKAEVVPTSTLAANKPNGNSTTFKSGYGFTINGKTVIKVTKLSETGSYCGGGGYYTNSNYAATITAPTAAEVRTSVDPSSKGWTVKNNEKKKTQGKTISLKLDGSATKNGSKFVTAPNPVSNYNKPLIYTDVALKGTKQKPVKHKVEVYYYGGGVTYNGTKINTFCASNTLEFTINGDMYEDDSTAES